MGYFNFAQAFTLIIDTLGYFLMLLLMLRMIIRLYRVQYNPFATQLLQGTDALLRPFKQLFPKTSWDFTTPTILVLVSLLKTSLLLSLGHYGFSAIGVIILSFTGIVRVFCDILFWTVLLLTLISWIPSLALSGLAGFISMIAEPILKPLQKIIPPVGGFDITPLLVILGIQVFKILGITPLETIAQIY
jgi:YggT family protein